jgi:hypothetical protein
MCETATTSRSTEGLARDLPKQEYGTATASVKVLSQRQAVSLLTEVTCEKY